MERVDGDGEIGVSSGSEDWDDMSVGKGVLGRDWLTAMTGVEDWLFSGDDVRTVVGDAEDKAWEEEEEVVVCMDFAGSKLDVEGDEDRDGVAVDGFTRFVDVVVCEWRSQLPGENLESTAEFILQRTWLGRWRPWTGLSKQM